MSKASFLITRGLGQPVGVGYLVTGGLGNYSASVLSVADGHVFPSFAIQLALDAAHPTVWTDVSDDIRASEGIVCEYGIDGSTASDRVASAGELSFALDNSQHNTAGRIGYYSVAHGSKRVGFDLNKPVRFKLSSELIDMGLSYYKFLGKLDAATPDVGVHGARMTHCSALDLMNDWADALEPDIDVQEGQTSQQLLLTLFAALPADLRPAAIYLEAGLETYPVAFDGGTGQRLSVRDRVNQIVKSDFSKAMVIGDTVQGGSFVYFNRRHNTIDPTVKFALTDDGLSVDGGLEIQTDRSQIYRSAAVSVYPTNNVAAEPVGVVYSLQETTLYVGPNQTYTDLFGPYLDPDTREQIGATSIQSLVAGLDYVWNSAQDGSGADQTAKFTVTAATTGSGVRWTLVNNDSIGAFATTLQLRGIPIRRSQLPIERTVAGGYGNQVYEYDMPLQASANVGADIASYLAVVLSFRGAQMSSVRFLANKSIDHMKAAFRREPGDRISVTESVSGITAVEVVINRVRYELKEGGLLWVTWFVEAISARRAWLLGVPGSAELGTTTSLGI